MARVFSQGRSYHRRPRAARKTSHHERTLAARGQRATLSRSTSGHGDGPGRWHGRWRSRTLPHKVPETRRRMPLARSSHWSPSSPCGEPDPLPTGGAVDYLTSLIFILTPLSLTGRLLRGDACVSHLPPSLPAIVPRRSHRLRAPKQRAGGHRPSRPSNCRARQQSQADGRDTSWGGRS
jgi:hypothetical protein